jgi:hypothetical protein
MTKLDKMPQQSIIDQYKGLIDFYVYKGVAVARRWPKWEPRLPTPAEAANQAAFKLINQIFQSLPPNIHEAYTQMAAQTTRTSKDVAVSLYMLGDGTEMPPDYIASEETQLLIYALIGAIDTLLDTKLDVALSTRAAESGGNLEDIVSALTWLNGFIPGSNKIFGYQANYTEHLENLEATAGANLLEGSTVPDDEMWAITNIAARDISTGNVRMEFNHYDLTANRCIKATTPTVGNTVVEWQGHLYLSPGESINCVFYNCANGDDIHLEINGYKMATPLP